jgi:putative ATPase
MENQPLAERLRPKKLADFVGQKEIVGEEGIIKNLIKNSKQTGFFPSIIFWGPPGSGKTTLARIIAHELKRKYHEFSAVNTSTKDVENIIKEQKEIKSEEKKTELPFRNDKNEKGQGGKPLPSYSPIIFIDEIHRFNKAQQDKLLPYVEKGQIILIGATTENPSFEVIGPLLSRCRVITLNQLKDKELKKIVKRGEDYMKVKLDKQAKDFLIQSSNGDARVLLTVLEIAANLVGAPLRKSARGRRRKVALEDVEKALQRRQFTFDKKGEEYYNVISAFIKSIRASDTNAALYYLARMVEAGQDPLYIARRMVIFASEDIGMAQPTAIVVANGVFRACETIGYPECAINLAHGVVYLSKAKKDRSSYNAYFKALDDVKTYGNLPVPLKIRNAPTKLMKELGYAEGYEKYTDEDLLPEKIKGKKYYTKEKNEEEIS